jgi:hypothetical protein
MEFSHLLRVFCFRVVQSFQDHRSTGTDGQDVSGGLTPAPPPVGERARRSIPQDVKIAVSARDGGRCRQCGSTAQLHFDHVIPISRGGANTVANIQLLCGACNRAKGAKMKLTASRGRAARRGGKLPARPMNVPHVARLPLRAQLAVIIRRYKHADLLGDRVARRLHGRR